MITSAHSKSSNSAGFNRILQKFYKMICEIIVSKTVCGVFLIFCWSSFINNFMVKKSFSEPKNQRKLNILRPIFFEKISSHSFVGVICTYKREGFFFFWKKFFSRTWSFFHDCSMTNLGVIFFQKKKNFMLFFKGDYLILLY